MLQTYRILEVRGKQILAQSLDRIEPIWLDVPSRSKFVENEVLVIESFESASKEESSTSSSRCVVMATRVDPAYIGNDPPKLIARGEGQFEFEQCIKFEDEEEFENALEVFRTGDYAMEGKLFRMFLKKFAYHIDTYHHLGVIEDNQKHRDRAFKYFEMGYRIGMLSVSKEFSGQLPWNCLENRPLLRAAHAYGLALEAKGRQLEAAEIYERILSWNPNDN